MNFEEVKQFIKQLNVTSVKITDTNAKKIIEFLDEVSPENLIAKLENFIPTLQAYGRVTFVGANAAQLKQNWKDCYQWPVIFSGITTPVTTHTVDTGQTQRGFVSHNEAALMAQLAGLQIQMQFMEKMAALERKIEGGTGKESQFERIADKYFPIVGPMLGFKLDKEQIESAMLYHNMQNAMSGKQVVAQQNGINGLNTQTNPTTSLQLTEEEKKTEEEIVKELTMLSSKTTDQKILALIKGLNQQPGWIDMAINFMNQNKT